MLLYTNTRIEEEEASFCMCDFCCTNRYPVQLLSFPSQTARVIGGNISSSSSSSSSCSGSSRGSGEVVEE